MMNRSLAPHFGFGRSLWDEFEREFDDVFRTMLSPAAGASPRPAVESWQEDGSLHVRVDLPGVAPEDVEVSLDGTELTIRGERKSERHEKENGSYREVRYGRFERRFTVPKGIDAAAVQARYENGVLALTLPVPKAPEAKRIPVVNAGSAEPKAVEHQKAA